MSTFYAFSAVATFFSFYAQELAMVILSWCLSQPGTDRSPGDIETSGFHRMIA